jgi:hypothetical protein
VLPLQRYFDAAATTGLRRPIKVVSMATGLALRGQFGVATMSPSVGGA